MAVPKTTTTMCRDGSVHVKTCYQRVGRLSMYLCRDSTDTPIVRVHMKAF